jgi:hypothetical protein
MFPTSPIHLLHNSFGYLKNFDEKFRRLLLTSVKMSSSTSPPTSIPTSHSKSAIIGGVIGGTLCLLLVLAAIFIPMFRQRRSCYDIALRRHTQSSNTNTGKLTRKDSIQEEKIVYQGDMEKQDKSRNEFGMVNENRIQKEEERLELEEMVGLEEMLRIDFPNPSRYELDGGSFVEGRANWEIKL